MVGPGWNQALRVDVGRGPVRGRGLEAFQLPLESPPCWNLEAPSWRHLKPPPNFSGFCLLVCQQREMTRRLPCKEVGSAVLFAHSICWVAFETWASRSVAMWVAYLLMYPTVCGQEGEGKWGPLQGNS